MKKKLDVGNITNELAGASLFFTKPASPPPSPAEEKDDLFIADPELGKIPLITPESDKKKIEKEIIRKIREQKKAFVEQPRKRDTATPLYHESTHASNNASMHASIQPLTHETIIETIRKAVKDVGKDSATYRFTSEEKKALLELSFSYKMQGYKTSENELARISINFLLEDHRQNGRNSVLQRVLDALSK